MIESLSIRNVALIESLEVAFGRGLNILSGETGAGKSILIDAVNFAVGGRAGRELIRAGASEAAVEVFARVSEPVAAELARLGAEMDEDDAVLLYRAMSDSGRGVCKINGKNVTLGMLKAAGALLVDIHGQHEHQSLLDPTKHLAMVDRFCGEGLAGELAALATLYKQYRENQKQIQSLQMDENERLFRVDMLTHQVGELAAAKLRPGEDEELAARKRLLANAGKLAESAREAAELLCDGGEDGEASAADKLYDAVQLIRGVARVDSALNPMADRLEEAYATIDDCARDFRKYRDKLRYDPREVDEIEARLDVLYQLKRKYGQTSADMLAFYERAKAQLASIETGAETAGDLAKQNEKLRARMGEVCERVTALRVTAAAFIQGEIEKALKDLGMKDAAFRVKLSQLDEPTANGRDAAEFLISANKGEEPRPLAKIASGGEMSRVMLALKATLADCDVIETFIFDEIDAGVSGRTARRVAEKLALVAAKRQVLCITHLPQIAAMGDDNFLIEKTNDGSRAATTVRRLDEAGVLNELARLIGGARITEATMAAARELRAER